MAKRTTRDYPPKYEGSTGPVSPYAKILKREGFDLTLDEERTKAATKKYLIDAWNTDESELMELIQKPNVAAGKKLIASCLINAIQVADFNMLNVFLNRICGKPKEEINITASTQDKSPDTARQLLLETLMEPTFRTVNES